MSFMLYQPPKCRAALLAQSDDEEHFQKKDRARVARDKARLNPIILGKLTKCTCFTSMYLSTHTVLHIVLC